MIQPLSLAAWVNADLSIPLGDPAQVPRSYAVRVDRDGPSIDSQSLESRLVSGSDLEPRFVHAAVRGVLRAGGPRPAWWFEAETSGFANPNRQALQLDWDSTSRNLLILGDLENESWQSYNVYGERSGILIVPAPSVNEVVGEPLDSVSRRGQLMTRSQTETWLDELPFNPDAADLGDQTVLVVVSDWLDLSALRESASVWGGRAEWADTRGGTDRDAYDTEAWERLMRRLIRLRDDLQKRRVVVLLTEGMAKGPVPRRVVRTVREEWERENSKALSVAVETADRDLEASWTVWPLPDPGDLPTRDQLRVWRSLADRGGWGPEARAARADRRAMLDWGGGTSRCDHSALWTDSALTRGEPAIHGLLGLAERMAEAIRAIEPEPAWKIIALAIGWDDPPRESGPIPTTPAGFFRAWPDRLDHLATAESIDPTEVAQAAVDWNHWMRPLGTEPWPSDDQSRLLLDRSWAASWAQRLRDHLGWVARVWEPLVRELVRWGFRADRYDWLGEEELIFQEGQLAAAPTLERLIRLRRQVELRLLDDLRERAADLTHDTLSRRIEPYRRLLALLPPSPLVERLDAALERIDPQAFEEALELLERVRDRATREQRRTEAVTLEAMADHGFSRHASDPGGHHNRESNGYHHASSVTLNRGSIAGVEADLKELDDRIAWIEGIVKDARPLAAPRRGPVLVMPSARALSEFADSPHHRFAAVVRWGSVTDSRDSDLDHWLARLGKRFIRVLPS